MKGASELSSDHLLKLRAPITGYSVDAVAAALGISARAMRRRVTSGQIATIAIKSLIPANEAARVLAQRRYRRSPRAHDPQTGRFTGLPP
jgi:hypothetical protein